jgi:hypothetical protein
LIETAFEFFNRKISEGNERRCTQQNILREG